MTRIGLSALVTNPSERLSRDVRGRLLFIVGDTCDDEEQIETADAEPVA